MTPEEKLKQYILARYHSVLAFSQTFDIPYATITSTFRRGIQNSSVTTILRICKALNISADELALGRITPNAKDETLADIETIVAVERTKATVYTIDEIPLSSDEKETLFDAIEIAVGIIKRKRESK